MSIREEIMNPGAVSPSDRGAFLLLGAAHVDRRAKADGPFHPGASNPGVLADSPGGSAFNAAVALRAMGCPVAFVGARGGDADGRRIAAEIEACGLRDLSATFLDRKTPTYTAVLDDHGELVAGVADMALYELLGPKLLKRRNVRDAIAAADALIIDANLPAATIAAAVEAAGERPVSAIGVSPAKVRRLLGVLPRLSALFVSRAEAAALVEVTAATNLGLIAELLAELGTRRAVISDGALEAVVLDAGKLVFQRPPIVRPRDVTGAGDTLAAVASAAHLGGTSFVESARRGIAAASLRVGATAFPPDDLPAEIERLYDHLTDPTPRT
ncbi:PfkB family carbohydrate kinase [Jiella avicenniae]|uniref:PfkB family carbohydrate kinase n=1 Tax=Jiella avicenniae TaxID=2907202 RepID=A0A9X1P049_9HYPH|nr:PfkB family carbohydrate kinase [Jiella avicenniae]MCE7028073.1 PfkB family carbohydrate kinase [Jiella avicenniae]